MTKIEKDLTLGSKKETASSISTQPNTATSPVSIYIDPKVKNNVEQLKEKFGNDDFIPFLANLDSKKPNIIDSNDFNKLEKLDRSKKLSDQDINIFKNALTMYKANENNSVEFNDLLKFTAQYSDIENGDLKDGLFIEQSPQTENMFRTSTVKEKDGQLEAKINDLKSNKGYSEYSFNVSDNVITGKTKTYENGQKFIIHEEYPTQVELLKKDGIIINKKQKYVVNSIEYSYDEENDLFKTKNSDDFYIYNAKTKEMIAGKTAFQDMYKLIYGENFFNKYSQGIEDTEIKPNSRFKHKMTDEDIQMIKNDETSVIAQIIKFNEENSENQQLKNNYDLELINPILEDLIKNNGLLLSYGKFEGYNDPMSGYISCNFQSLITHKEDAFETLYHELTHSTQAIGTKTEEKEQQAHKGSKMAKYIKENNFDSQKEQDIDESVKYSLNYFYFGKYKD